jgi:hypothetical protein
MLGYGHQGNMEAADARRTVRNRAPSGRAWVLLP